MKNISQIPRELCTGCEACLTVCALGCISFCPDGEGFMYPEINAAYCVQCGKCLEACPVQHPCEQARSLSVLAAAGRDRHMVEHSSSGGAFFLLAKFFIEELHGLVCGAVLDEKLRIAHMVTDRLEDVRQMQGSKYIQSRTEDCYAVIGQAVANGRKVLFCGTPCQVAGLCGTVRKGRENLLVVDLICHGVPSSLAFASYMKRAYGDECCENFSFRMRTKHLLTDFSMTWHEPQTGTIRRVDGMDDPFYAAFLAGENYRECCYRCPYANPARTGDLTIGDCASADTYVSLAGRSLSTVMINTPQGNYYWNKVSYLFHFVQADTAQEIRKNRQLCAPVPRTKRRDLFYTDLNTMPLSELKEIYCKKKTLKGQVHRFLIRHTTPATRARIKRLWRRRKA